jgi:hypothetical protein
MIIKRDHVRTAGKGRLLEAPDDDRTWSRSLWLELESTIEMENSAWNGARAAVPTAQPPPATARLEKRDMHAHACCTSSIL